MSAPHSLSHQHARYALYYAPDQHDPLWALGSAWLGWDAAASMATPQPVFDGLADATARPRRYGFHATLKAPIRLSSSEDALRQNARALAARHKPFALPPLALPADGPFLRLELVEPCLPLQALADDAVAALDHHRRPPDEAELLRRRAYGLSAAREANLRRWGYPDVFAEWRFHMTLSRRLSDQEFATLHPAADAHFHAALSVSRMVRDICLFVQPAQDAPFTVLERLPLGD